MRSAMHPCNSSVLYVEWPLARCHVALTVSCDIQRKLSKKSHQSRIARKVAQLLEVHFPFLMNCTVHTSNIVRSISRDLKRNVFMQFFEHFSLMKNARLLKLYRYIHLRNCLSTTVSSLLTIASFLPTTRSPSPTLSCPNTCHQTTTLQPSLRVIQMRAATLHYPTPLADAH